MNRVKTAFSPCFSLFEGFCFSFPFFYEDGVISNSRLSNALMRNLLCDGIKITNQRQIMDRIIVSNGLHCLNIFFFTTMRPY